MTHCISRLLPAVMLGALASVASGQSPMIGWTYTTNMTIDSGGVANRSSVAIRSYIMGGKLRIESVQVSNMAGADEVEGMYQILNAADSTMTMVMPTRRAATIMNVGGLGAGRPLVPQIEQHVKNSQVDDLGPGEKILGHATRRIRVTSEATVSVKLMTQSCTGVRNSVSEMWIAPDVDLSDALGEMSKTMTATLGPMGVPETSGSAEGMPKGTPLRTIAHVKGVNAHGDPITVTTTMEYVGLTHGPLDPSLFAAPAEFKVTDMRQLMASIPAGMLDSAMDAGASSAGSGAMRAVCRSIGAPEDR